MAKLLPIGVGATRLRLQRLLQSTVSIRTLVNPSKIGFPVQTLLGFKVEPRSVASVVNQLATYERTRFARGVAGAFDVISTAVFRSMQDLQAFLEKVVAETEGIRDIRTNMYLQTYLGHFANMSPALLNGVGDSGSPVALDTTDAKIISHLMRDGRLPARQLAQELAIAELTVHRRLKRLVTDRVITVRGMVRSRDVGFPVSATIGLNVDLRKMRSIAERLRTHKQINLVATCTGTFNIIAIGTFTSNIDLDTVLRDFIYPLDGIKEVHTLVGLAQPREVDVWIVPRI